MILRSPSFTILALLAQLRAAAFAFSPVPITVNKPSSVEFSFRRDISSTTTQLQGVSFANSPEGGAEEVEDDSAVQWELFKKYHAKGSWKGIWTTYDYIGDVQDETIAAVDLTYDETLDTITHSHQIVVGAKRADCETCFDSMQTKTLPVATYAPTELRKTRLGSCGMVVGPTLMRSGAMATELVLAHGDGRIRVIFQHAPVWERGTEPGTAPPDGLKLFRTMVSRETLRDTPPTPQSEQAQPPQDGNPIFYRPVPPFNWHKKWGGTCWTWGPSIGNKGWGIEQMEEGDDWHGSAPVELWNLRLPGGIFLQTPRIITHTSAALCRLAWLPNDETLLRVEAGVLALQPVIDEENETLVGFYPPSLASYRCDSMRKVGELDGEPQFVQDQKDAAESGREVDPSVAAQAAFDAVEAAIQAEQEAKENSNKNNSQDDDDGDSTPTTKKSPVIQPKVSKPKGDDEVIVQF